jgi:peptide/nickel transport system permease protein
MAVLVEKEQDTFISSQPEAKTEWQVAFRQLKKNKLAMAGFWILAVLYFFMIFADFIAPYDQAFSDPNKNYYPPVAIHFFDAQGRFHLHPFVYDDVETPRFSRHYVPDTSKIYPIHLFYTYPGAPVHNLLGIFPMRVRLFGVDPPARIFLFGSDQLGRDVFSRILYGSRMSLTIGFVGVLMSYSLGLLIGGISGFYAGKPIRLGLWWFLLIGGLGGIGGFLAGIKNHSVGKDFWIGLLSGFLLALLVFLFLWIVAFVSGEKKRGPAIELDNWLQRLGEMLMMFPSLYLLLGLRAMIPENIPSTEVYFMIVLILAFISFPFIARIVRGMVLSIREQEFVSAAEAVGCSNLRMIVRHIIPNTFSQVIVLITLSIPNYILGEAFLSFLDLGIREPQASWGNMLTQAQNVVALTHYPWILLPGLFIFLTVLGFNLLGDGLRDALDPKMRS